MFSHDVALAFAYTGAALGVVMVVPQLVRTARHPALTGASPLTWALTALACGLWLTYGVRTGTIPQIPGNVLLVSGAVAVSLLVPSPVSRWRRATYLALAAAALVAVAVSVPPHLIGYLAFAIGLTSVWPQLFETLFRNKGTASAGLSISSWTTKVISQGCWLAYALLLTDIPVAISATVGVTTTLVVVWVELSRRRVADFSNVPVLEPASSAA